MKKKFFLLILFISIIFILSFDQNSSIHSKFIVEKMGFGENIYLMNYLFRKGAHITIYFILSLLFYHFFKNFHMNIIHYYLLPLFLGLNIAFLDEMCQTIITGRSGSIKDVGIDLLGILGSIIIIYISTRNSSKKHIINVR